MKLSYINMCMSNLEYGVDDLTSRTEIETQTQKTDVWTPKGWGGKLWDELGLTYKHN